MPKWTNEEDKILLEAYTMKLPRKEIFELLNGNHSIDAISNRAKHLNIRQNVKWSKEELNYLINNYSKSDWNEITHVLSNHTKENIISKASELKIKREQKCWTQDDIDILKKCYDNKVGIDDIRKELDYKFSVSSIYTKASKLNLIQKEKWTDDEIEILYEYYENSSLDFVKSLLPNRKLENIKSKAHKLGLVSNRNWTQHEDEYIKNNWELTPDEIMSQHLNRSFRSIKWRREILGFFRRDINSKNYESITKYIRANISKWKNDSMKKCQYKCVLTGSKEFQIHHLYGVNNILHKTFESLCISPKEKFIDYTEDELKMILDKFLEIQSLYPLGECIRTDLHVLFHSLYGQYNNTPEQWYRFKEDYNKGTYDYLIKNIA